MFSQQFLRDLEAAGEQFAALNLCEVSAVDAAQVVQALLSGIPPSLSNAQVDSLPKTDDGRRDASKVHEMEKDAMLANFWRASEAVLCRNTSLLRGGIVEGVNIAKAVQTLARFLIDTKAL